MSVILNTDIHQLVVVPMVLITVDLVTQMVMWWEWEATNQACLLIKFI